MAYSPELAAAPRTSRYEIVSLLGRGATSVVYEAFDIEKNFAVALKLLKFPEQDDIYEIKREFRFFRDFYHPNVVNLYDLFVEDDVCFYTMELIEGADFVSATRSDSCAPADGPLRSCLCQLLDGLAALHDAGRLHRDIKPSNILVEPSLRTVLLDFGLAAEAAPTDSMVTLSRIYAGTPAYMAPERLAGDPASPASDLYAVGVVLYEALTGRRPYSDAAPIAQYEAQKTPPEAPRALDGEAPADLADLALALLAFDPAARPSLAEARRAARPTEAPPSPTPGLRHPDAIKRLFVGRDAELARLEAALRGSMAGASVVAFVSGVSGVGKTTLIERFLADARDRHGALVLRSRCHHQESVRYKAIDGLVDMLSRHLVLQGEERLRELAPEHLPALVTVFPVLGRVPFPFDDYESEEAGGDPHEILRRAFAALGELLRRIAARRPLILWIDDLQWSDTGSVPFLREVAASARGASILQLLSYRADEPREDTPVAVLRRETLADPAVETEDIVLGPLETGDVGALIRRFAGDGGAPDEAWVRAVAEETAGLPFFVIELAAFGLGQPAGVRAAEVIGRRVQALPARQRAVLELISVAGAPLAEDLLVEIGAPEAASGREVYHLLNQNLLRRSGADGRSAVEAYHDRIRVTVLETLDEGTRRHRHRQIADGLARAPAPDHQLLVEHYLGAGEGGLAAESAITAGRAAADRLAFESATELFALALDLRGKGDADWPLAADRARALADAGRSVEAGECFLGVAKSLEGLGTDRLEVATYEARAAQQLLYGGRLDLARGLYRDVFANLQLPFPETLRAARRMSVANRIPFLAGLKRFRLRSVGEVSPAELLRIDTLGQASKGFLMLDYVVGDAMFSWYLREAAALGERSRLLRAMAIEAAVLANIGRRWSLGRSAALIGRARGFAEESADPQDRVVLGTCESGIHWFQGHWRAAADTAAATIELHRRDCGRYDFEIPILLGYRASAMVMQGLIGETRAEVLQAIDDARRRGDAYVSRLFKSGYWVYVGVAADDPQSVIEDSRTLLHDAAADRFTSLHWSYYNAMSNALTYAGRAWEAWALAEEQWPLIRATGFLGLACIGSHLREIRSRAALHAALSDGPSELAERWPRERLAAIAEDDARHIARAGALSHAAASAAAIRAGIAALRADDRRRRTELAAARDAFGRAEMRLHQAAAELQLGALLGGDEGAALQAVARCWMEGQGIRRPDRMAAFLIPSP